MHWGLSELPLPIYTGNGRMLSSVDKHIVRILIEIEVAGEEITEGVI